MRSIFGLFAVTALLSSATSALQAQDVLTAAPASYKVLTENARVRVVQGSLAPGQREASHVHAAGWYYVTQGGVMKVTFADGRVERWAPKTGESFWGDAEGAHSSENIGRTTLTYVLVEVKDGHGSALAPSPRR